jgi:hypothetical protein
MLAADVQVFVSTAALRARTEVPVSFRLGHEMVSSGAFPEAPFVF